MKRYIAKTDFEVNTYDDDGFYLEETTTIAKGTEFELCEDAPLIISAAPSVHLESDSTWIEISPEHLAELFEEEMQ